MLKRMRSLNWLEALSLGSMLLCLLLIVLALIVPSSFIKVALMLSIMVMLIVTKMEYNSSKRQE